MIKFRDLLETDKRRRGRDVRGDFMSQYRRRITRGDKVSLKTLLPGDIVTFHYIGKDVHTPRPIVVVLNSNWEGKLHGLALRHIPVMALNHLFKVIAKHDKAKQFILRNLKTMVKLPIDIYDPQEFYKQRIKPFMSRMTSASPYRTYTIGGISNARLVKYYYQLGPTKDVVRDVNRGAD